MSHFKALVFAILIMGCRPAEPNKGELVGTWSIERVNWISPDTSIAITPSQKGLLLVNDNAYSISWSPIEQQRVPFVNLSNPTMEEIQNGFQSIVFNAGSCKTVGAKFITTAKIAKVPGFEGGKQYYYYKLKKDTLSMTLYDETYPNGDKPQWYGKWRTEFTLVKIDGVSDFTAQNL